MLLMKPFGEAEAHATTPLATKVEILVSTRAVAAAERWKGGKGPLGVGEPRNLCETPEQFAIAKGLWSSHNRSLEPECPQSWSQFSLSCYYVSKISNSWDESKKVCEGLNSHLVVINSEDEQDYVTGIAKRQYTWIGLSDENGPWKWVDGTLYDSNVKFWIPGQPDDYTGHGLGGGEDCAHLHGNGQWNDDHCSRKYRYMCEKEI
ncbi:C-type lectin domain family 10 member A-like [Rhinophrynus dorsalis]